MDKISKRHPRKVHAGGRPRKPTPCPRCGAKCETARKAQAHC